jgi:hypothetical protein
MKKLQWFQHCDFADFREKLQTLIWPPKGVSREFLVPLDFPMERQSYSDARGRCSGGTWLDGEPVVPVPLSFIMPIVVCINIERGWAALATGEGDYPSQVPLGISHLDNYRL